MGISRRLNSIPREIEIGETWVYIAHIKAILESLEQGEASWVPGVFQVFKPSHFDLVINDKNKVPDKAKNLYDRLEGKGRIVVVEPLPDDDEQKKLYLAGSFLETVH